MERAEDRSRLLVLGPSLDEGDEVVDVARIMSDLDADQEDLEQDGDGDVT